MDDKAMRPNLSLFPAATRTRILELEIKNHRRSEMMASRKERARAEAEAATILQRAAKGLLRRCRLKVGRPPQTVQ